MKNTLKRIELEQRIEVLKTVREQAVKDELYISTNRGQYQLKHDVRKLIINNIDESIEWIKERFQELTGLNYDELERLNKVGE